MRSGKVSRAVRWARTGTWRGGANDCGWLSPCRNEQPRSGGYADRSGANAHRRAGDGVHAFAPWHFLYLRPDPQGHGSLRRTLDQSTLAGLLVSPSVRARPAPTTVGALRGSCGGADAPAAAGAGWAAFAGSGSSAGTSSRMPNAL